MDKISVIIPVYNAEDTIQRCIESIMTSAVGDVEVICVDDGSTDNSLVVLKKLAERFSNLIIINQENKGAAAARENGLSHAIGLYVCFCVSDDYVESCWLKNQYDRIKKLGADIAVCRAIIDGKMTEYNPKEILYWKKEDLAPLFIRHNEFNGSLVVKMFKKNLFDGICYDDKLRYYEDAYLIWQMIKKDKIEKIVRCNEGLYHYVIKSNSLTHKRIDEVRLQSVIRFWEMVHNDSCTTEHLKPYRSLALNKLVTECSVLYRLMLRDKYFNGKYERHIQKIVRMGGDQRSCLAKRSFQKNIHSFYCY